jgi:hypothetical protein
MLTDVKDTCEGEPVRFAGRGRAAELRRLARIEA